MIWVIIGYMFLFIWRPFEIWSVLADVYLERFYMIGALGATLLSSPQLIRNRLNGAIVIFAGAIVFSWLVSPWRGTADSGEAVERWLKVLVFYFLVVLNVRRQQDVQLLIWGFCAAVGLLMVHSIWEFHNGRRMYAMGIPRMIGINLTFRQPNTFSATLLLAAPLFWVALRHGPTWWVRVSGGGAILMVVYCSFMTGSRTAFVGLLSFAALLVAHSRYRLRVLLTVLLIAPVAWQFAPERIRIRFLTVFDESVYEREDLSVGARTSAETRAEGFYEGWRLFNKYPLTGVGPGAWIPATGWAIQSHNLYGQLPGELGMLGMAAFAYLLWCYYGNFRQIRRMSRGNEAKVGMFYDVSRAIEMSILLMLVTGMAGHSLYRFNWVWFAAFLTVTVYVVSEKMSHESDKPIHQANTASAPTLRNPQFDRIGTE